MNLLGAMPFDFNLFIIAFIIITLAPGVWRSNILISYGEKQNKEQTQLPRVIRCPETPYPEA